ncbi:MAG: hypothetical protein IPF92_01670 [Myxococcales bacterium]|nr:hypothetical protein [Myxococcales bacterium]MBL0193839.1 hypothetical protein [Myxococcales bacterium]
MAGRYGMSFAKGHIERGDYDEAISAATSELEGGATGPEPYFDRATAKELLEDFAGAADDFEAAIRLNLVEKEMDPFALDDAYFSTLVAGAQAAPDAERGLRQLARYRALLPEGEHVSESREWELRLQGKLPSLLDKTRGVAG